MDRIVVTLLAPSDRSPFWRARWSVPGSTRRRVQSLKTADETEADRLRADLEYELNHNISRAASIKLSWEAFSEKILEERYATYPKQSQVKIKSLLKKFGDVNKPKLLSDVDEQMLTNYATHLRKKGLRPASIKTHLSNLRSVLRWAVRQKLISSAPNVEPVRVPKKNHVRVLSDNEYAVLLASLKPDWALFVQVAWLTGMRRGELLGLRWEQQETCAWIDWQHNRIQIPAEACKAKENQWIPMHPNLAELLAKHRQDRGRVFSLTENQAEVSKAFCRRARWAGVKCSLHDLRRSFGTRYARVVPAQILQRLMRHASIKTTLEYYVNLDDSLDAAIKLA